MFERSKNIRIWKASRQPWSEGATRKGKPENPKRERGIGAWVSKETERLGAKLDPEVRSWIDNVIVPAMVHEYIEEHGSPNIVAAHVPSVRQFESQHRLSAEGIQ